MSRSTLDRLISHADTITLRALQAEDIPLIDRGRLASQFSLKKMADKVESVVINLNLSDELMQRIMARLDVRDVDALAPNDVYIAHEPNEPNEQSTHNAPSPTDPPSSA